MKNIIFFSLLLLLPSYSIAQAPTVAKDTLPSLSEGDTEDEFADAMDLSPKIIIIDQKDEDIPKEYNKKEVRFFYETSPLTDNVNASVKALPKEYTGFKIQLLRVDTTPLAEDDLIFFRHGNVIEEPVGKEAFSYLIGHYETEEEALIFMEEFLLDLYPDAIVVRYKEGNRI